MAASSNYAPNIYILNSIKTGLKTEGIEKIGHKKPVPHKNSQSQNNSFDFTGEDSIEWQYLYLPTSIGLRFTTLNTIDFLAYKEQYSEQFHPDIVPPPPKA